MIQIKKIPGHSKSRLIWKWYIINKLKLLFTFKFKQFWELKIKKHKTVKEDYTSVKGLPFKIGENDES